MRDGKSRSNPQNHSSGTNQSPERQLSYVSTRVFDPWGHQQRQLDPGNDSFPQDSGVKISPPGERSCAFTFLPSVSTTSSKTRESTSSGSGGGRPRDVVIIEGEEMVTVDEHSGHGPVHLVVGGIGRRGSATYSTRDSSFCSHPATFIPASQPLSASSDAEGCLLGSSGRTLLLHPGGGVKSKDRSSIHGSYSDKGSSCRSAGGGGLSATSDTNTRSTNNTPGTGNTTHSPGATRQEPRITNHAVTTPDLIRNKGKICAPPPGGGVLRRGVVKRSMTMAGCGDLRQVKTGGRHTRRFTCIDRNRFLENRVVPPPVPSTHLR